MPSNRTRLDRYNRWVYLYWWPYVTVPSFAGLGLVLLDPTDGGAQMGAWTIGSVIVPGLVSALWWRTRHGRGSGRA